MHGGQRRVWCAATALAAVVGLGGCSEDAAEPTAAPTSSESPSETTAPSEPPEPEPVDPCSLLTEADLEAVGLRVDMDQYQRTLGPGPTTTSCLVADAEDGWAVSYGFSMKPGVSVADAIDTYTTEKPIRLRAGDQARMAMYDAYGDTYWYGWASEGRYSVVVELFDKPRPAQVEQLLGRMLEQVGPEMLDFPVDLPAECPSPRARPIARLLGEVATATGSAVDGEVRCMYATRRGLRFDVNISPFKSRERVVRMIPRVEEYFDERTTPARGVTLYHAPGEGYAYSYGYVLRPPALRYVSLEQQTRPDGRWWPFDYDADTYRAAAAWWATRS